MGIVVVLVASLALALGIAGALAIAQPAAAAGSKQSAADAKKIKKAFAKRRAAQKRAGTGHHLRTRGRLTPAEKRERRRLEGEQTRIDAEASQLQSRLEGIREQRDAAERAYDAAQNVYMDHLDALYRAQDSTGLAALVAARSVDEALGAAQVASQLADHDRAVVDAYRAAADGLAALDGTVDTLEQELASTDIELDGVRGQLASYQEDTVIARDPDPVNADGVYADSDQFFTTGPLPILGGLGAAARVATSFIPPALPAGVPPPARMPDGLAPTGRIEQGEASWYGPGFHQKNTANGEVYDQEAMTAAHKTLPFNTWVKVTLVSSGRSVFVRINDRGPFVDGRIIDLSHRASQELGLEGVGAVTVEVMA